jgi:hypothetical protein
MMMRRRRRRRRRTINMSSAALWQMPWCGIRGLCAVPESIEVLGPEVVALDDVQLHLVVY